MKNLLATTLLCCLFASAAAQESLPDIYQQGQWMLVINQLGFGFANVRDAQTGRRLFGPSFAAGVQAGYFPLNRWMTGLRVSGNMNLGELQRYSGLSTEWSNRHYFTPWKRIAFFGKMGLSYGYGQIFNAPASIPA